MVFCRIFVLLASTVLSHVPNLPSRELMARNFKVSYPRNTGLPLSRSASRTHTQSTRWVAGETTSTTTPPRKAHIVKKKRDLQHRRADGQPYRQPDVPILPRSLFEEDPNYRPEGSVEAWCVGASLDMSGIRDKFFFPGGSQFLESLQKNQPVIATRPTAPLREDGLADWLKKAAVYTSSNIKKAAVTTSTTIVKKIKKPSGAVERLRVNHTGEEMKPEVDAIITFGAPELDFKITSVFDEVLFGKLGGADVFLFNFGVIVGWGVSESDMDKLRKLLRPFVFQRASLKEMEQDEMKFCYWNDETDQKPAIKKDTIPLRTSNTFEKLAYSYGFAQSTKLSVFESVVDQTIDRTKRIPESLARYGTTWMSRNCIAKQLGQLFVLRCNVNLQSDILDTPEILWDFDEWESLYIASKRYLSVSERVRILNQRLDVIKDLYDILNDELGVQQSHREGLIIIALISLELIVEIFKELVDIPAIASFFHALPNAIQSAAKASPIKFFFLISILTAWTIIASPLAEMFRKFRAKLAFENSVKMARAGGGMYLQGPTSDTAAMLQSMVGKLSGTGPDPPRRGSRI
uniref:DUF155 domain-containing protein n=1 Tax=Amorphochlora amoebiformis TaxID=1561963 RepID=A0A7S0CYY3_9EUKA|mmetsp:Transcript_1631/g.2314  ORF Transcript_1631/g.2314 Transcript_1631/m.2314 type:complete len:576 (+) Transcript_1631:63-1790(+)